MSKYIDADKLIAEIDKRLFRFGHGIAYNCWAACREIVESLQQELPGPPFLIEMAIVWFNNIAESAKKLSAGNVSHLAPTIVGKAIRCAEFLEKGKQEQPEVDLEKDLGQWRHKHFKGIRDDDYSGEYLERESQLDLARHFYELGLNARKENNYRNDYRND